mmetsp:Transcript_25675/g.81728  ORF Transcript_25675/g.81728 Transcript_25675/m.81728 type:complete len:200 (+) Transcript_25675:383-982(+)
MPFGRPSRTSTSPWRGPSAQIPPKIACSLARKTRLMLCFARAALASPTSTPAMTSPAGTSTVPSACSTPPLSQTPPLPPAPRPAALQLPRAPPTRLVSSVLAGMLGGSLSSSCATTRTWSSRWRAAALLPASASSTASTSTRAPLTAASPPTCVSRPSSRRTLSRIPLRKRWTSGCSPSPTAWLPALSTRSSAATPTLS